MKAVETTLADSIEVRFVHMPIPGHKFARSGAIAVECANAQGLARPFISRVYEQQDSIGIKSWTHFAMDVGIVDTSAFDRCRASQFAAARVDSASQIAKRLKISGTPTILVNGWRFSSPSHDQLVSAVRAVSRGKSPI